MLKFFFQLLVLFLISFTYTIFCHAQNGVLKTEDLRCEYLRNPVIEEISPRLNWKLSTSEDNQIQSAYQILVASSLKKLENGKTDLWNSGKVKSNKFYQIRYRGKPLTLREVCYWKVRSWDKNGNPGQWSEPAEWSMGLMSKDEWKAKWIGLDLYYLNSDSSFILPPVPVLRKEFNLKKEIKDAKVYVTALGLYNLFINGQKVGDDYFTPGWTDYNKRVYYQTYDVKSLLKSGRNAIGSELSYGWYAGYIGPAVFVGLPKVRGFYGQVPALKAQLEITYTDGSKDIIVTDKSWKGSDGPLRESDIQMGDTYDAGLELKGWNKPDYDESKWKNVEIIPDKDRKIEIYPGMPVRITQEIKPAAITKRPDGKYIFNMGQNFAGVIKLKVKGNLGQKVVIRYGEMLNNDGSLMTENLRKARATDTYILKGDTNGETWIPQFTYHGFQYVEITGYPGTPDENSIIGLVLGSEMAFAGSFETSDPEVNRLYKNIVWTQRSNMIEVPTDCPQRDERLGYSGDSQIFIGSAVMNMNVAAFFTKWLVDLNDDQNNNGLYPDYAPTPLSWGDGYPYHPGWMEGGIIIPFTLYKTYGDTRILQKYYPQMKKLIEYGVKNTKGKCYYDEGEWSDYGKGYLGLGDWLSIGATTSDDIISSIYLGYTIKLMNEIAGVLGYKNDAGYFRELFNKFQSGFISHYLDNNGIAKIDEHKYDFYPNYKKADGISGNTQTTYANLIYMHLLPDSLIKEAANHLAGLINQNDGKLATGFLGVKQLLPALSETGNTDLAHNIFLNKEYPGWLYEIENGATSMWEHWDSYSKKTGFASAGMNSFDHYAFGSVCEWMFHYLAGIQNEGVAYDSIILKPEYDKHFSFVNAGYESIRGKIISSWKTEGSKIDYKIEIPVGTKAVVYVPSAKSASPEINGKSINSYSYIKVIAYNNGYWLLEVPSGKYDFTSSLSN